MSYIYFEIQECVKPVICYPLCEPEFTIKLELTLTDVVVTISTPFGKEYQFNGTTDIDGNFTVDKSLIEDYEAVFSQFKAYIMTAKLQGSDDSVGIYYKDSIYSTVTIGFKDVYEV